ncbi:hypothetical protein Cpir12675_006378 [Ceratocystis pirilliformis]|uniref:Uncharacterized protein n=1 Tax=Ceratocystis pirilliformis TaxID=259994 RepID=A0ABR3YJD4_9PEZI
MLWKPAPKSCSCSSRSSSVSTSGRVHNPGKRIAQVARLKAEYVTRYKQAHSQDWAEVERHMRMCNIENCKCSGLRLVAKKPIVLTQSMTITADTIFHETSTNLVFASFNYTGYDFTGDMERLAENSRVKEWRTMVEQWQERPSEGQLVADNSELDLGIEKESSVSCSVPGLWGTWKLVEEIAGMS